jgi:hypothetical protein
VFCISTCRDSFRRIGTIVLFRLQSSKEIHFWCVQNFEISWFVLTNRYYFTAEITWPYQASFLLFTECPPFVIRSDESGLFTVHITLLKQSAFLLSGPEFRHFLIRSDELELFYYKNDTAQTSFIFVVYRISTLRKSFRIIGTIILYRSQGSNKFINDLSNNSTFRNSFRRIGTIVLYRSHGSYKFHFCCGVYKFYFPWFVPKNWDYCTVQIAWLKHATFLLYPECRLFVIRSDESGL